MPTWNASASKASTSSSIRAKTTGLTSGMERTPAPAVDSLVVGGHLGGLIELRVLLQQRGRVTGPRLVAQAVELRDQPDPPLAAEGRQLAGVGPGRVPCPRAARDATGTRIRN